MNKNFILALIFSIFFLSPAYSQESSCRCDEGLFWDGENCVDVGITCIPSLFPICDCNGVVFKNLCEAKKSGVKKFINAHCSDFNISSCTCENEEPVSLDCFSGQSCKFENQLDSEAIASEFSGVWKIHIPGEALFLYGGLNKVTGIDSIGINPEKRVRKLARVISLTVCAGGGNIVGELNQKGVFKKVPLHVSKVYSSDDVLFSTDKLDNSDKFNILRARLNNNSVMEIEFASGNTFLAAKVRPKSKLCRRLLRSPN